MFKRLPPLKSLRFFEVAGRHLNFTKAAEELYVTQAAVSHQIKALEEFLGIKLFRRRNRTLYLTAEGQSYYHDIKAIFERLSRATERVQAVNAKGSLTVSLPPSFAIQWLVPRLSDFNKEHPDIDVRIKSVDMNEGSLTDDVDVAVYFGKGKWSDLQVDLLFQEYIFPVCSPQLIKDNKPLATLDDLENYTLLHDSTTKEWKDFAKEYRLQKLSVKQGTIFSHSSMVLQAAIHGQGVALSNNVLVRPELEAGRLITPLKEKLQTNKGYYIVCHKALAESGRNLAFREWIKRAAAADKY